MKKTKLRSKSSHLSRKRTEPISIATSIRDSHVFEIKHYPDFSIQIFGVFLLLSFSLFAFALAKLSLRYFPILFIVLLVNFLFENRSTSCLVNKQLGQIDYFREGLLGSSVAEQEIRCNVAEIKQLEMKWYIRRFSNTFKVILVLNNGQRLPLSSNKLGCSDGRRVANRLSGFLEHEIPLKGID